MPLISFLNWCNPIHSLACFARRAAVEERAARRTKHARLGSCILNRSWNVEHSSMHLDSFMDSLIDSSWLFYWVIPLVDSSWLISFIGSYQLIHIDSSIESFHSLIHLDSYHLLVHVISSCVFLHQRSWFHVLLQRITAVSASIPKGYSRPAAGAAKI